jgi:hypothetical protein
VTAVPKSDIVISSVHLSPSSLNLNGINGSI